MCWSASGDWLLLEATTVRGACVVAAANVVAAVVVVKAGVVTSAAAAAAAVIVVVFGVVIVFIGDVTALGEAGLGISSDVFDVYDVFVVAALGEAEMGVSSMDCDTDDWRRRGSPTVMTSPRIPKFERKSSMTALGVNGAYKLTYSVARSFSAAGFIASMCCNNSASELYTRAFCPHNCR